ncbi:MAG: hypothetical protein QOJ79_2060 [Actinomycetota bacterium]|nr:hypothetical protein [Actinomycetota bacterium]
MPLAHCRTHRRTRERTHAGPAGQSTDACGLRLGGTSGPHAQTVGSPTFLLYRLAHSAAPSEAPQLLGIYRSYEAALAARDADIIECLERAGGRRVELTHEVHSCPEGAACSTQRMACAVGQPVGWPVELRGELAATARWLSRLRARGR